MMTNSNRISGTATATTVVLMGNAVEGNRDIRTYVTGESYEYEADNVVLYTSTDVRIPYTMPL
jgi:hypothetical protein